MLIREAISTVKKRLRDAGLLGRVAKKKPYLRQTGTNQNRKRSGSSQLSKRTSTLESLV